MDGSFPELTTIHAESSSRRGLRIALLSYRSPSNVGGQGVYVEHLSKALTDIGCSVDVISGPPYPEPDPRVTLIKLPSLDLYAQPNNGHGALRPRHLRSATDTYEYFGHLSGKFVEPYTFGQRAFKYLQQHRSSYDIVLDNQTLATGVLKIQEKLSLPLLTMIHHPITFDRRLALQAAPDPLHRWLVKRWYAFHRMQIRVARKLTWITSPSESARRDVVEEFGVQPTRITPIHLGVDRTAFRPRPDVHRRKNRLISTASADTPLKGLPILIQAFHDLLPEHPDLELVVIGKLRDGATKKLIEQLGLRDRIWFRSGLTRDELAKEFCAATIAITPSLYEGFGLPASEAMSCGTPVIVSDGGALPEVAGDAGVVVPRGKPGELAKAISTMLNNPEYRALIGQKCLERATSTFDWRVVAKKYEALMREAIALQC